MLQAVLVFSLLVPVACVPRRNLIVQPPTPTPTAAVNNEDSAQENSGQQDGLPPALELDEFELGYGMAFNHVVGSLKEHLVERKNRQADFKSQLIIGGGYFLGILVAYDDQRLTLLYKLEPIANAAELAEEIWEQVSCFLEAASDEQPKKTQPTSAPPLASHRPGILTDARAFFIADFSK